VFEHILGLVPALSHDLYFERIDARYISEYVLPLAQHVLQLHRQHGDGLVVGIAGGSGAGKTTLGRFLSVAIERLAPRCRPLNVLALSYDNFFVSKRERAQRGLTWRNEPGGHDIDAAVAALAAIKAGASAVEVPVFDKSIDDRAAPMVFDGPVSICVMETIYDDGHCPGEHRVNALVDYLIYLDQDLETLSRFRFQREARMVEQTGQGFSPEKMVAFWNEAIETSIKRDFWPLMDKADLVIRLNRDILPEAAVLQRA
jgi:pantothenate kinase-related protein Tda10